MNLEERLLNYVYDIVEGKILACKKHLWACKRFLKDLERVQADETSFYFDIDQLYDFYEWCKQFKHFKGVLSGQYIELTDFQLFIAANIFSFLDKKSNNRRFLRVFIELARKNAKSQFLALVASYIAFLSKQKEECYIAGWDRKQSSLVYKDVVDQLGSCPLLHDKYKTSYGKITHIKTGSIIEPLSKEAKKTGDGTNPSLGIIDEYHSHETTEMYDVIDSGMGARENTLMFIITTAGFNINGPCYKEYKYVSQILDPDNPIENDEYFAIICELDENDDIKDEKNWIKANPIVATYEAGIKKLKSDLKVALEQPDKMRSFLTKRMNLWLNVTENGYMNMAKWNKCGNEYTLDAFRDKKTYIGVDLSSKEDITSVGFEHYDEETATYVTYEHSWMPEEKYIEKMARNDVPYNQWVDQGHLTIIEGAVIDQEFVEEYIKAKVKEYEIAVQELCYDEWNAIQFAKNMEDEGFTCVAISQTVKSLSEATTDFRLKTYKGKMKHPNDGLLSWTMSNAITYTDPNNNIKLDKKRSPEKIDPVAALINAHVRCMTNEKKESVYESRGIVVL